MPHISRDEVSDLDHVLSFIKNPERYGCKIDWGEADTREKRIGHLVAEFENIVGSLRSKPPREYV